MGAVIRLELPEVKPRLCIDCANGALSRWGIYCLLYQEIIEDETLADECELWEE